MGMPLPPRYVSLRSVSRRSKTTSTVRPSVYALVVIMSFLLGVTLALTNV